MSSSIKPTIIALIAIVVGAVGLGSLLKPKTPQQPSVSIDPNYRFPYLLDAPDQITKLPDDLDEISGLAYLDQQTLLAIQDEKGILFYVEASNGSIRKKLRFGKNHDYEDLTRIDSMVYVLENDGDLHYFPTTENQTSADAQKLETGLSLGNDVEGLCYDPISGNLLLAPKEDYLPGADEWKKKHHKPIYAFNLTTRRINPEPWLMIDLKAVGEAINGDNKKYSLKPSGIAVHPDGNSIFLLASVGKVLVVLNRAGALQHIERLDKKLFRQPEGIAFSPTGELFISNEAKGERATILRFRPGKQ